MAKTLLENRWPVVAVLSDERVTKRQYRYLDMSSEKWASLEELVKVLEPLEVASVFLSKEQNSSLSAVYPVVHGLVECGLKRLPLMYCLVKKMTKQI